MMMLPPRLRKLKEAYGKLVNSTGTHRIFMFIRSEQSGDYASELNIASYGNVPMIDFQFWKPS